jgi:hypothetical protein
VIKETIMMEAAKKNIMTKNTMEMINVSMEDTAKKKPMMIMMT